MPEPLDEYITIEKPSLTENTIKKSRFIAQCFPVDSKEEADKIVANLKKEHYKANHVCSAYVLATSPVVLKSSDDGEPSGTAGIPILEVIQRNGLKNVLVTVTRYFGGIKLGKGGLIRAYSGAASDVIKQAQKLKFSNFLEIEITIEYTYYNLIKIQLEKMNFRPEEEEFLDIITLKYYIKPEDKEVFIDLINSVTQGNVLIDVKGTKNLGIKL